jgi:hypothetical protein
VEHKKLGKVKKENARGGGDKPPVIVLVVVEIEAF